MRTVFAVAILLALVLATFARPQKPYAQLHRTRGVPANILAFVEGFALGVEASIGNLTECTQDAQITLVDFQNAYTNLKYGFQHLKVDKIQEGLHDIAMGVDEIAVALKDCNVTALVTDLEHLVEDIKKGLPGVLEIIVKEAVNIFHHGKELTADFKNFITYWGQQKWELAGVAMGKIVGILIGYRQ